MPGRIRVGLTAPIPAVTELEALAESLSAARGVQRVEIRRPTGSVIIHHNGDFESLSKRLARSGLLVVSPPEKPGKPFDAIRETVTRVSAADTALARATGGRADLWGLAFAGLIAAGAIQLARGRVAGPALALFGQAATLALIRIGSSPPP
jgi:hypothetical protein